MMYYIKMTIAERYRYWLTVGSDGKLYWRGVKDGCKRFQTKGSATLQLAQLPGELKPDWDCIKIEVDSKK